MRRPAKKTIPWVGICALAFLVSACQPVAPTPYIPPASDENQIPALSARGQTGPAGTQPAQTAPTSQPGFGPEISIPTMQSDCTDGLQFQDDLTVPDGSLILPGAQVDKRWRVVNSGTCNWNELYRLKFSSGFEFAGTYEVALFPARSGTQAMIRLVFPAPEEPGTYRTAWQAYNPIGEPFGDIIYMEIVVQTPD